MGVLLLTTTFAFIQAGRFAAGSRAVIAAAIAVVVLLAAFVLAKRRTGDQALLPLTLTECARKRRIPPVVRTQRNRARDAPRSQAG